MRHTRRVTVKNVLGGSVGEFCLFFLLSWKLSLSILMWDFFSRNRAKFGDPIQSIRDQIGFDLFYAKPRRARV